ncbi:MAG: flippase-like domain-containing protein [Candidatus Omnitrophica bacterium]|nr:flippase-like domain-containing protein [Candidatus Omnitrophota bacterium]
MGSFLSSRHFQRLKKYRRPLIFLAGLGALVLFCYVFDSYKIFPHLKDINFVVIFLCLGLTFIYLYVVRSFFWKFLFKRQGVEISFYETMKVLAGANFSTLFVSGKFNEPLYVFLFHKKTGLSLVRLAAFVVFERLLYMSLAIIFFMASIFRYYRFIEQGLKKILGSVSANILPLYFALGLGLLIFFFWLRGKWFYSQAMIFLSHLKDCLFSSRFVIGACGIFVGWFLIAFACNLLLFQALPQEVLFLDWQSYLFSVFATSVSIVFGALSFLPFGVGPGEFAFGALLVSAGIAPEISSAFVFFSALFYFITVTLTFIFTSLREKKLPRYEEQTAVT